MKGSTQARIARPILGLVALVLVGLGLWACSKRITTVDPAYVPEGRFSPDAQLVVWFEAPNETLIYLDRPPLGPAQNEFCGYIIPGEEDSLINRGPFWRRDPGILNGVIVDGTRSTAYQMLRREGNGGFRQVNDFAVTPLRRWPEAQHEEYTFLDRMPSGFSPATYVGRGFVSGTITKESPLTNVGLAPRPTSADTIANMTYTGFCNPCDSLFTLRWSPVPGAARYWMQVYRYAVPATISEQLAESVPTPFVNTKTRDIFVGSIDAPDTAYKIGASRPTLRVMVQRPMDYISPYFVRVSAVDRDGRLIAYTRGDYGRIPGDGRYTLFPMGAVLVAPSPDPRGGRCRLEPPFP
jgi:hypothetical protein